MLLRSFVLAACVFAGTLLSAHAAEKPPVVVALDGEFGHKTSTSAQAVQQGMEIAMDEINRAGGVLGGRKLELVTMDNRSIPAIGVDDLKALAGRSEVVGVFGAKFSPVVMEWIPVAQQLQIPVFATWSSADPITDNGYKTSWAFRLSLKDAWAAPTLLRYAADVKHAHKIGVMLPNTSWGRSNREAIVKDAGRHGITIVGERWYNWGDKTLLPTYQELRHAGAEALLFIGNEGEGSILVKEMAALPEAQRMPVISHWGVTGGRFVDLTGGSGGALAKVDFSVVQTYSFVGAKSAAAKRVLAALKARYGIDSAERVDSPVGVAHAYDLMHILARAIDQAGSTDRGKIRDALEHLGPYDGLVRRYDRPFTPERHDALSQGQVFMARYNANGVLVPIPWAGGR